MGFNPFRRKKKEETPIPPAPQPRSNRVAQEFYCNHCDGYFLANLNFALNINVAVICPSCEHRHLRQIKDGILMDNDWQSSDHEIICLKTTYRKTPYTDRMAKGARSGVALEFPLNDRWVEVAAREKGQI